MIALYRRLALMVSRRRWFPIFLRKVLTPLDRRFSFRSRPLSALGSGFQVGLVTTTGRLSQKPRTVPLLTVRFERGLVLIDTGGGSVRRPAWSHNLREDPRCMVDSAGTSRLYLAKELHGEDRNRAWAAAVGVYPSFDDYAARLSRSIRVFHLIPQPGHSDSDPRVGG